MQGIDNIISNCINKIDNKIKGVNFLETLKYSIINELKSYTPPDFTNTNNYEYKLNNEKNFIVLEVIKFDENFSTIKKISQTENLCITLLGLKKITVKDKIDSQYSSELHLPKLTGLVLAKNIIFDELIIKDTILLNIHLIDNDQPAIN